MACEVGEQWQFQRGLEMHNPGLKSHDYRSIGTGSGSGISGEEMEKRNMGVAPRFQWDDLRSRESPRLNMQLVNLVWLNLNKDCHAGLLPWLSPDGKGVR